MMIDFFNNLIGTISNIGNFFINAIRQIIDFFILLGRSIVYIESCLSYLPLFISIPMTAILAVIIIKCVLNFGRN